MVPSFGLTTFDINHKAPILPCLQKDPLWTVCPHPGDANGAQLKLPNLIDMSTLLHLKEPADLPALVQDVLIPSLVVSLDLTQRAQVLKSLHVHKLFGLGIDMQVVMILLLRRQEVQAG